MVHMRKFTWLWIGGLLIVFILVAQGVRASKKPSPKSSPQAIVTTPSETACAHPGVSEEDVRLAINEERESAGSEALDRNETLDAYARAWLDKLAKEAAPSLSNMKPTDFTDWHAQSVPKDKQIAVDAVNTLFVGKLDTSCATLASLQPSIREILMSKDRDLTGIAVNDRLVFIAVAKRSAASGSTGIAANTTTKKQAPKDSPVPIATPKTETANTAPSSNAEAENKKWEEEQKAEQEEREKKLQNQRKALFMQMQIVVAYENGRSAFKPVMTENGWTSDKVVFHYDGDRLTSSTSSQYGITTFSFSSGRLMSLSNAVAGNYYCSYGVVAVSSCSSVQGTSRFSEGVGAGELSQAADDKNDVKSSVSYTSKTRLINEEMVSQSVPFYINSSYDIGWYSIK